MKKINYKASLDILSKIITFAIIIIFIIVGGISIQTLEENNLDSKTIFVHSGILFLLLIILILSYLYSVQGYIIENNSLIIRRFIGNKKIDKNEITEIQKMTKDDVKGTFRRLGVGGLFGYFGQFHNPTFGRIYYYTTQRKNMILLKIGDGKKVMISPDNMEIIDELN